MVVVLFPSLVILWGLPDRTAKLWAWTIKPDLTPIFMGAGYGAGTYFFARAFRARQWHTIAVGVLGAAAFAALMMITTFIHLNTFNQGDAPTLAAIAFYGWVTVYIGAPFLVGALWYVNRRTDAGRPEPVDAPVPATVRGAAGIAGFGAVALAAAVLIEPRLAIDNWGWRLTPLTARVLACFAAQVGVGFLMLSRDRRWSSWKLLVETFLLAVALLLIGAARAWGDFDASNPLTWTYVVGLAVGELALAGLYVKLERAARAAPLTRPSGRRPAA